MDILPQLLVNALIAGSIYALASSGLSLTYGLLRILNFAHGHIMMVGAYLFYWASAELGFGLFGSAIITILGTIVLGCLTLNVFVMPFSRFSFFLAFVTTLSLSIMLESIISMLFGVNVKSLTTGIDISSYEIAGIYITPIQIVIIISALVLLSILAFVIHSTSLGRRIRAVSEFRSGAEGMGISTTKVSYLVFIVGCLLAAYAGVLVGYETNLQPTMGNSYTIKAFAAMILGGLGNIWGTVAGSYILGLVENLSIGLDFGPYSIPAGYKDAFAFVIILVVLLFRPQGLFSRKGRVS
ncbi:MAG: branched-chain amino acid ABC transporter permease [Deltaproteobacteria bacterium]|nr:branched-chain amino acid ABC transporter permease [Deltaproteobacteria bacterium]